MKRIGILSDTHCFIPERMFSFFEEVDEIWHAGDIGDPDTYERLGKFKPLKAVYGNIDGHEIRSRCPEMLSFTCEELSVLIMHIGGYPGRYSREAKQLIERHHPDLFICGHSHILKVIYDHKFNMLTINPGSAGKFGFHKSTTMIRLVIDGKNPKDLEVLDLPK